MGVWGSAPHPTLRVDLSPEGRGKGVPQSDFSASSLNASGTDFGASSTTEP
jgi:hypothetical protein